MPYLRIKKYKIIVNEVFGPYNLAFFNELFFVIHCKKVDSYF